MKRAHDRTRTRVLRRVKPTKALTRRALAAAKELAARSRAEAKRRGLQCVPALVGSLRKDTHLGPAPDIDLFLLFPPTTDRATLERVGLEIGKSLLARPHLRYAEHPYVRGTHRGFAFDVVPAFHVKKASQRMSAVDRTPFHSEYVRKHLTPRQRDEVRLLKQFLQGIGCYGAETAVGGFSGYLAELLILKFGDFWRTAEAFARPDPPTILGLGRRPAPLGGPLVFEDPVDRTRNAAAAVTEARLRRFARACRAYVDGPTQEFFSPSARAPEPAATLVAELRQRGVLLLRVPRPRVAPEAARPHVSRLLEKVTRRLTDEGFRVVGSHVEPLAAGAWLLLWEHAPQELDPELTHRGPPTDDADNSRRFLQKWQGHPHALELPHPVDGRWRVRIRRLLRTPHALLDPDKARLLQGFEWTARDVRVARFITPLAAVRSLPMRRGLSHLLVPKDPWIQGSKP